MTKPTAHNAALATAIANERARLQQQIDDCKMRIEYIEIDLCSWDHTMADRRDMACDLRSLRSLRRTAKKLLKNLAA